MLFQEQLTQVVEAEEVVVDLLQLVILSEEMVDRELLLLEDQVQELL